MTLRATYRRLALLLVISVAATLTVTGPAAAVTWTHNVIGGYDVWYLNGTQQKFRYNLSNQQWWHFSTVGSSWYTISSTGRSNTFIGDGHWRDLGNGFSYQYSAASDQGKFEDGAAQRFMYKYASGQWYDSADTLSWQALGAGGLNAAFLGDGAWYNLGNGFTFQYSASSDTGTFKDGAPQRFQYNYASGQWYDSADTVSWQTLGTSGLNAGFLGDGHWRDIGNGFTYQYSAGYDKGTFKAGSDLRFLYKYASGQWYHSADTLSWQALGASGRNAAFIGTGSWCDLGNGFQYLYSVAEEWAAFRHSGDQRFLYNYPSGQWYDSADTLSWQTLGASGLNAGFLGDGHWRDLGNGFTYQYSAGYDKGTFKDGAAQRFMYKYGPGQWYHSADTLSWQALGAGGLNAAFVGDGAWYGLGNGFTYQYSAADDKGTFKDGAAQRFMYEYASGQWYDSADTLSWEALGASGLNAAFLGSGSWFDLGNGFSYQYSAAYDKGTFKDGAAQRFMYKYAPGQWYHSGDTLSWQVLGANGLNAAFLGSGDLCNLGAIGGVVWWYRYDTDDNGGYWRYGSETGFERFFYCYSEGIWYSRGYDGAFHPLGASTDPLPMNAAFVGDGQPHDLGLINGAQWRYTWTLDDGMWQQLIGATYADRFRYYYWNGWWFHFSSFDYGWALSAEGRSSEFMGDGLFHELGVIGGLDWSYAYDSGVGTWMWTEGAVQTAQFKYDYALGQWQDFRADGYHYLGGTGVVASFLGDGEEKPWLNDGFTYTWVSGAKLGRWSLDATHYFQYGYAGTSSGWSYSLDSGITWLPWSQTTIATDFAYDPAGLGIGGDGLLYFRASNASGLYDLYRWDGSTLTNISDTGFDEFYRSYYLSGVGTYFTARHGSEWDLYLSNNSGWHLLSDTTENYSNLDLLLVDMYGRGWFSATNASDGHEYLYRATTSGAWLQSSTQAFDWVKFATGGSDYLCFYGEPVGGTTDYVYRYTTAGFARIEHGYSLGDLVYAGRNDIDLFFWGQDGVSMWDVYRVWNDSDTWTFTNISNSGFAKKDADAHALGTNVYFTAGNSTTEYVYLWNGSSFSLFWGTGFSDLAWSTTQGGALYYAGQSPSNSLWSIWRIQGADVQQVADYQFASEPVWTVAFGSDLYWIGAIPSGYDLYRWDNVSFTRVTADNFVDLQFQTQMGTDLYFAAATGGVDPYYLLRYNGATGYTDYADLPFYPAEYAGSFEFQGLIWRGDTGGGIDRFWLYNPWDGNHGYWSLAQASGTWPVSSGLTAFFNTDYYFSGRLDSGSDYTLMRYWGAWEYLTQRSAEWAL